MKALVVLVIVSFLSINCRKEPAADSSPQPRVDVKTSIIRAGDVEETV
ncbi:MAG: hypothetical protein HY033_07310, partial [Ignavibacteriae bacterium]|nr:hypothetical protein [Ignavibacteriota bacterium]